MRVSDINVMSRYASGVRVMRLDEDARVVTFARAEHDEEEAVTIDAADLAEAQEEAAQADAQAARAARGGGICGRRFR